MMPQMTATMSADQPRPVAAPMAHHSAMDSEQQHEVPGDGGAAEHAGALSGAGRGLLQFGLGQFQFLPHQGGQIPGDLGDQLTQRSVAGRSVRVVVRCLLGCSWRHITARVAERCRWCRARPSARAPPAGSAAQSWDGHRLAANGLPSTGSPIRRTAAATTVRDGRAGCCGGVVGGSGQPTGQPAGEDTGAQGDREVGAGLAPGEGPDLVEQAARVTVGQPPGGLVGPVRGLPGQVGGRAVLFGVLGHPGQFVGQRVQALARPAAGCWPPARTASDCAWDSSCLAWCLASAVTCPACSLTVPATWAPACLAVSATSAACCLTTAGGGTVIVRARWWGGDRRL